jgi:hypothetical protein
MLVKHVEQSGIFNHVLLKDIKDDFYLDPHTVKQLTDQGVDFAVVGHLGYFYAFQDMPNAGLSMFGDIEYHFDDKTGAPASNAYYWMKALKEANNRFVKKLNDVAASHSL